MLSCRGATATASRAMDQPIPWRERISLRFHLIMCVSCARFERQLHFLRSAAERVGSYDGSDARSKDEAILSADARARLRETVARADPTTATS